MLGFKTELNSVEITGEIPDQFLNEDKDYNCIKAIINWNLDFEIREHGIKDTYANIIKVTLIFSNWDYGEVEYIIDDNNGFELDWVITNGWSSIMPRSIWVDFDNKTVEVEL